MERIVIALGSNLRDPVVAVGQGWAAVCQRLQLRAPRLSHIVRSAPAEGARGNLFANAVGIGETDLQPLQALALLQAIEQDFGRDRTREGHHGPRTLDLDLIDLGGARIDSEDLALPHPRLAGRDFVLAPLAEVAPDFVDVRSGRGVGALLAALPRRWIIAASSFAG